MRKKVLFLITKATHGGAQRYVYDLATNLPKEQFLPIVAYGVKGQLARDLADAGIQTVQLPSVGRDIALVSDVKSFSEIRSCIKEIEPDIVHLNSSKAAGLGAVAARMAGVPKIVFTVHGWPFKEARVLPVRVAIRFLSWLTALFSHEVIVVSEMDERLAKNMWGIGKKVQYIPLGLAPLVPVPPAEGFAKMFGAQKPVEIRNSTLRLASIGELTPNKGFRFCIAAVSKLLERGIDSVYVVAGEGEEREELLSFAKKHGVENHVFFPGFIPHAARNLSGFDVFVLPSVKEGTPYVLLEAALVGIPVVATSAVDEALVRRLSSARIVPIGETEALADAIVEVSKLPRTQSGHAELFKLSAMISDTIARYLS